MSKSNDDQLNPFMEYLNQLENQEDKDEEESDNHKTPAFNQAQKSILADILNEKFVCSVGKANIPNFYRDKPDLWFIVVESEFNATRIRNDQNKYNQVIRALDVETLSQITDIIYDPPLENKYQTLKDTIIKRMSESREKKIQKLLRELELLDKKPSQLLREMRQLAKDFITNDMLHQLWLDRMPMQIKPLLVASENLTLDALSEMADRLMDVTKSSFVMATTNIPFKNQEKTSNNLEKRIDDLQKILIECMKDIKELKTQQSTRRPRSRSSSSHRDKSICYYHNRFGTAATRCTTPCSFTSQAQGN